MHSETTNWVWDITIVVLGLILGLIFIVVKVILLMMGPLTGSGT